MWSNYTKVFVFRDCLDENVSECNVTAIDKLLSTEQIDKSCGALITTDFLTVSTIIGGIEVYNSEDDGIRSLLFFSDNGKEIACISLEYFKEVHLCFEIEEEVETGEFKIHYCTVKGFKEYQV